MTVTDCDWYVTAVREAADWTVAPLNIRTESGLSTTSLPFRSLFGQSGPPVQCHLNILLQIYHLKTTKSSFSSQQPAALQSCKNGMVRLASGQSLGSWGAGELGGEDREEQS